VIEIRAPSRSCSALGSGTTADGRIVDRQPSLAGGLFNHQAIVYSRSLHQRFGPYLDVPD
jgi:hypothetical protein